MFLAKLKKMGKKKMIACAAVAAAIVIAAGTFANHSSHVTAATVVTKEASVKTGDLSTTISGTGTLAADESASIQIPAGIKIDEVLVSAGDTVKKGTKIASVNKASAAEVLLSVNENIEDLLAKRHFIKKMRNATHKHHLKGPRKRTDEDNEKFVEALEQLLDKVMDFQ